MVVGDSGVGGVKRQSAQDSWVSEAILYDVVMMDTCYYTFVKMHRIYNTKSELWSQLWTWGDIDF